MFTALEKLPADRFATAAEFAAALANPMTTTARTSMQPVAVHQRRRSWLVAGVVGAAALLAGVVIGGRAGQPGSVPPDEVVRATLGLGDSAAIRAIGNLRLAHGAGWSADRLRGQRRPRVLALGPRFRISQPRGRLPDTKGAFAPFFSPDGLSVGFFTSEGSHGVMKVISSPEGTHPGGAARLGRPVRRRQTGATTGRSTSPTTTAGSPGSHRAGGAVTVLSRPDSLAGVEEHDYPDVLPGSKLRAGACSGRAGSARITSAWWT